MKRRLLLGIGLAVSAGFLAFGCNSEKPDTDQAVKEIKQTNKNLPDAPPEVANGGIMRGGGGPANSQADPNSHKNSGG